ncbi:hypothetical protein Tsubulata_036198 [Turnera subulata]|uniref:F-box domain-containing protein n=1 Tax=Turnera subulata TaxID=218843 RepID=A0A9Q0JLN5_9ROSI|nr:hypothetical protein Tsubulata_036198 [Turnera subulata]
MSQQIELPEDPVREILVRLPVTSLTRFKSVCNSWRGTINHPDFIRDHLNHVHSRLKDGRDNLNDHDIIEQNTLIATGSSYRVVYQSKLHSKQKRRSKFVSEAETITVLDELPKLFPNQPDKFIPWHRVRSSCDGLLLITAHYRDREEDYLLIYNPTTRECKRVGALRPSNYHHMDAWGIGYDHTSQSYKVVRAPSSMVGTPVQVLSLKTDSWKTTTPFDDFLYKIQEERNPVTANRCPHWVVTKRNTDQQDRTIIYFDPSEEIFKVMPPPSTELAKDFLSGVARGFAWYLQIFEVRGGLGLCMNKGREELSLWWMKEHGVKESWTKLYNVCKTPTSKVFFTTPWFLTKRGKLLFVWNATFYSYDPGSHTIKALPHRDHFCQRNILQSWRTTSLPTPYLETLVSPFTT